MTHQWLGPNHRRSFWAVSTAGAVCLGYIKPDGNGWAVYVATDPGPGVPADPNRLLRCDDAESAAKAMCAYWRVPYVALEPDTTGDDL